MAGRNLIECCTTRGYCLYPKSFKRSSSAGTTTIHQLGISASIYWPSLRKDVEAYVKGCDVCLALKVVWHKPYGDLQALPVPTHRWKDESYDSILVIIDRLTKMMHYKLIKITIGAPGLSEVILNMAVRHHGLPNSIVTDRGSLFTSKFWSSL